MKDDGGPAFPVNYSNEADGPTMLPTAGMSLRDWFAGTADSRDIDDLCIQRPNISRQQARYCHADAMLKAREGE